MAAEDEEDSATVIKRLEKEMREAAARLDFEVAAVLRDKINLLKKTARLKIPHAPKKAVGSIPATAFRCLSREESITSSRRPRQCKGEQEPCESAGGWR